MKELQNLILKDALLSVALSRLNVLKKDAILIVVDNQNILQGALTDGDIRRALLDGKELTDKVSSIIQNKPVFISEDEPDVKEIIDLRTKNYKILPIVNSDMRVVDILNFRIKRSYLPIHAIIMAGGEGKRLRPLTEKTPKPLLIVGNKPIIEHNVDRLIAFGVKHITISIKYLGQQIIDYFGDGSKKGINIDYISEDKPLGTAGALKLVKDWRKEDILLMNSDLLTTFDVEAMYLTYVQEKVGMCVATVPYRVDVPYGIMEFGQDNRIKTINEKPTFTYYANAGIYIFNKKYIEDIPELEIYNATDLMQFLINRNENVLQFPITSYWLDIGKPDDFEKANSDIKFLNL